MLLLILGYIAGYAALVYVDYSLCIFLHCEWAFWIQFWAAICILIGAFYEKLKK